jgi:hypothetical protein
MQPVEIQVVSSAVGGEDTHRLERQAGEQALGRRGRRPAAVARG